jgi:methylmalonyl-CoA mutase C-terminal domain/subunit
VTRVPRVVEVLKEQGIDDALVTVGGTIPSDDIPQVKALGVAEVFTPCAPTEAIIDFIRAGHEVPRTAQIAAPHPAESAVIWLI